MSRKAIWMGVIVGSTIGGCVPSLWHASVLSVSVCIQHHRRSGWNLGVRRWMT
jgi:hypothetical protein